MVKEEYGDPTVARFWKKVDKSAGPDGCWIWTAARQSHRRWGLSVKMYGRFRLTQDRVVAAHRYSYEIVNGAIPMGLFVCHACDVVTCVNPAHLWLGTHRENVADMMAKGRNPCGEKNSRAKITESVVHDIFTMRANGLKQHEIAKIVGVGRPHISNILHGKLWAHMGLANG